MNHNPVCPSFPLEDLLNDDCDLQQREAFESHVEECEVCQRRLATAAGCEQWWTKASAHLSTIEQLALPPGIQSSLSRSSSFFIPTIDEAVDSSTSAHRDGDSPAVSGHGFDWRQILDPPTHPEMLGCIDQFEIESMLGKGGMGIVLKGFDRQLNRAVAIKILSPHLASNGTSRKRFEREAQAAAAVVHPNVVPIYAVKACQTRPYIVMQLVSGHSLQSLIHEKGPLNVKDLVRVAMQVADGLEEAHQQGLIHRDIKPGNVLIEQDVSRVMITDFGLARAADDAGMTQTGWIAGTPHYMSPEQARGESLDCRSDLFSLGGLMYYLATGREPFRAESPFAVIQKIINEDPASPLELNNELPPLISDIIEKLLEKNPHDRFHSAAEVQELLKRYLSHLQQPAHFGRPKRVLTRRRRRLRHGIAGLIAVAILLTAGTVFWNTNWLWDAPVESTSAPENAVIPLVTRGTADSTDSGTAINGELGFPAFFLDRQLESEIRELQREIETLENSLKQTSPLNAGAMNPQSQLDSFSAELFEFQLQTESFQQIEQQNTAWLKSLLRQQEPNDQQTIPKLQPTEKK